MSQAECWQSVLIEEQVEPAAQACASFAHAQGTVGREGHGDTAVTARGDEAPADVAGDAAGVLLHLPADRDEKGYRISRFRSVRQAGGAAMPGD